MPLPTDLVPVNKPLPVKPSTLPADLIPIYPNQKKSIDTSGTGLNVIAGQQIEKFSQPTGDVFVDTIAKAPINDDERTWLVENKNRITPEQLQHSLDVFSGKQSDFLTKGQYYYDDNGIPQQIKFGQEAPALAHTNSIWGSQHSAEDDNVFTTFGKSLFNAFIDIAKLPSTLAHLQMDLLGIDPTSTHLGDIPNQWDRTVQALHFETSEKSKVPIMGDASGKPFTQMADMLNPTHYHFTTQNVAGILGSVTGTILQMVALGGGGTATKLAGTAEEGLSLSQKLAPLAKKTAANSLYMINGTYDEASRAGLKGRERFAVSVISALGQGLIMSKMFPELPAGAIGKETQSAISKEAVDAFVAESGGAITPQSLRAAYEKTLYKTLEAAPKAVSKIPPKAKQALITGSAMVANHAFDNGVLSLDAHLTGRTDENELFSPQAFADYFNSFVSGMAMGTIGGFLHKTPEEQTDNQSKMAYAYIREGRESELIHNLDKLAANNQLTPEQHADAIARVNGYKRYATETKNVKLTDDEREEVFNNIFKDEKVKKHLEQLEADTTLTPAFREAQIKVLRSESTGYVNEIAKTMGRKETPVETAKAADKTGEELPGENQQPAPGSKAEMRQNVVKKFTEANPGYKHHKAIETGVPTENLAGRWTIANEGKKAQAKIKAGTADAHDIVEAKRYEAFKKLKVGDVLHVHRFLPEPGKKVQVLGRVKAMDKGYKHLLNAFDEEGNQVGSVDYQEGSANDRLVNELLDQGHEVKLVVSDVKPNGEVEYQIASKVNNAGTADEVRAEHTMPTEGWIRPRQLHEHITEHLKGRRPPEQTAKPVEPTPPTAPEFPVIPADEINFENPPVETSKETVVETSKTPDENVSKERKVAKPKSTPEKEARKRLIESDPKTFEQAVLQRLVGGMKISQEHMVKNMGAKLAKEKFMFAKKEGQKTDLLNEAFDLKKFGITDNQVAENELFDILRSHTGKASMVARLVEITETQKSAENRDTFEALRGFAPETMDAMESEIDSMVDADIQNIPINDALVHLIDTVNPSMEGLNTPDDFMDLVNKNKGLFDTDFYFEKDDYEKIIKQLEDEKRVTQSEYGERIKAKVRDDAQKLSEELGREGTAESGDQATDTGEEIKKQEIELSRKMELEKIPVLSLSELKKTGTVFYIGERKYEITGKNNNAEIVYFVTINGEAHASIVLTDRFVEDAIQSTKIKTGYYDAEKQINDKYDELLKKQIGNNIKYQSAPKSDIQKEIEKSLSDAVDKLETAKRRVISRRKELNMAKLSDNEDLFGERKSQQEQQLFDERASGDIEKVLTPQKNVVTKLELEVEKLKSDLEKIKSDDSQTELQFQSPDNTEKLYSSDSEFNQKITKHLAKTFPQVKVFSDPDLFQEFLNRNFPGAKLDTAKLGAAIGDAVYINPNRAVQSTAIHEHAHIYWDALGDTKLKKKIIDLFGDEESAITAIGKLGTEAAKIKLSADRKLKLLQYAKEFWAKVKNLFGLASKEDLATLFASDVWNNAERIQSGDVALKYNTEEVNDAQRRVISQLQCIADNFDYDPLAHTYTLADTETQYTPVNDLLSSDPKYKQQFKGNSDIPGERGKRLHTVLESMVKGDDFEKAITDSKLKFTDEAKEQFRKQVSATIETLRGKGQLLPETIFANSYFKTAGRPDLPIISKTGLLHIYDWKTSTITTEGNKLYEEGTATTASKKDRDGTQIAIYAKLAEHGDPILGVEPQKIGEAGIIPIRLTIGKDGEITKVTVEKIVDVPYRKYKTEAERLLRTQHEQAKTIDSEEFVYKGAKGKVAYMKAHGMDVEKLESELEELPNTAEGKERQKEIYDQLQNIQAQFQLYQKQFQIVKRLKDADLSQYSYAQLVETMNTINSYDSLLRNVAMREIQLEAGNRMSEMETERLAKVGVQAGPEKDLPERQVFFKALSDISQDLPALQGRIRDYFAAKQAEETEHSDVDREARKLFADVIKENGGGGLKNWNKADLSKYFENLFAKKSDADGPAVLKDWKDLSNNLKQSERVVLHFMDEKMSEFQKKQALSERGVYDGFYAEIAPNFWEAYHKNGFVSALASKFREDQPEELGNMQVTVTLDGKKSTMSYSEAEKAIADYGKKNLLTKTNASVKLARAYAEAKKLLDVEVAKKSGTESAIKVRGAASRYTLNDNGEMVSKFHWKRPEGKEVSYDVYRSFMSYMTDQIHIKHMQPLLPELNVLETYYKQKGNTNTLEFMRHWVDGDIFGKEFVGTYGRNVDAGIKFLQGWTYYNVMPFNMTLGKFNLTTGKLNQIRAEGVKKFAIGEKRYFSSFRKMQGILQHYNIVEPATKGPVKNTAGNFWETTSNFFVSGGENSIRGAAFLSNLTEAEFKQVESNFDAKGNIIDKSKDISPGRIFQVRKMTEDVQGKYAFADKRMYKHYAGLRAAMMFKGWMLDFVKERFGEEYTDLYGVTHKGSYRSLPYRMRDVKTILTNYFGTDVNAVNNRKNVREIMIFATMMGIYATAFGNDKDKKDGAWLMTMTTDLLGPLNLSRTKTTIAKPFPIMGAVSNFCDALTSLLSTYQKDSTFGSKGDWMFPVKILNVLPYNRLAKGTIETLAQ